MNYNRIKSIVTHQPTKGYFMKTVFPFADNERGFGTRDMVCII